MDLSAYISPTESSLAIINGKLYKVDNQYNIYYFIDYFKDTTQYDYDIKIDKKEQEVTVYNKHHNDDVKRALYIDYTTNIRWLKDTLTKDDDSIIHNIHTYLLYTAYQKSLTSTESTEQLLAKERIYTSNILQEYKTLLNRISGALYESVEAGHHSVSIVCKMSYYTVTKDSSIQWSPNHKTSHGITCSSLDGYIAYLLRDTLSEYGYDIHNESQNVDALSLYVETLLRKRFPHLLLQKCNTYTFKLSLKDVEHVLL
jgi:hypothetical protein